MSEVLDLARELISRPSVTPDDAGCQELMIARLERIGFTVERMRFGEVDNFWARRGSDSPTLCFAGHTDVVPTGPVQAWQNDPFDALIDENGMLCGRGAADMKGSLASMIIAVERIVPSIASRSMRNVSLPESAARISAPKTPSAAASVGVASPA